MRTHSSITACAFLLVAILLSGQQSNGIEIDIRTVPFNLGDGVGVAVSPDRVAKVDSFGEYFQVLDRSTETQNHLITLGTLREGGIPGSTSQGQDGMTAVAYHGGFWYVTAASPFTTDALFRIDDATGNHELLATVEISNVGNSWSRSAIFVRSPTEIFVSSNVGLFEFNDTGTLQRSYTGDINGVTILGDSLFAANSAGQLLVDSDITDTNHTLVPLVNLGTPIADLEFGTLDGVGEAVFVLTNSGEIGYWTESELTGGTPGLPTELTSLSGQGFDLAIDGSMYAARGSIVELTVVPEPSAVALSIAGVFLLLLWRAFGNRRRSRVGSPD